jgi:hypothetical protein
MNSSSRVLTGPYRSSVGPHLRTLALALSRCFSTTRDGCSTTLDLAVAKNTQQNTNTEERRHLRTSTVFLVFLLVFTRVAEELASDVFLLCDTMRCCSASNTVCFQAQVAMVVAATPKLPLRERPRLPSDRLQRARSPGRVQLIITLACTGTERLRPVLTGTHATFRPAGTVVPPAKARRFWRHARRRARAAILL